MADDKKSNDKKSNDKKMIFVKKTGQLSNERTQKFVTRRVQEDKRDQGK